MVVQYEYSIKLSEGVNYKGKMFAMAHHSVEMIKARAFNYFKCIPYNYHYNVTIDDVSVRKVG